MFAHDDRQNEMYIVHNNNSASYFHISRLCLFAGALFTYILCYLKSRTVVKHGVDLIKIVIELAIDSKMKISIVVYILALIAHCIRTFALDLNLISSAGFALLLIC